MPRACVIVLDAVGAGELPDAAEYGDEGSDTLGNVARAVGGLDLPSMEALGLGNVEELEGCPPQPGAPAVAGRLLERSKGKDTTTGHWEHMGIVTAQAFPTYPHGFPHDVIDPFMHATARGVIGNKPASGTEIIQELGEEHQRTGKWIVYTSADSVFQIAAHEETIPLEELYEACRAAREILTGKHAVGRVIARPFTGEPGNYVRTANRHDFSLVPRRPNYLSLIRDAGQQGLRRREDRRHLRRAGRRRVASDEVEHRGDPGDGEAPARDRRRVHLHEPRRDRHALGPPQRPGQLPPVPAGLRLPPAGSARRAAARAISSSSPRITGATRRRRRPTTRASTGSCSRTSRGGTPPARSTKGEFADVGATVNAWLGGKAPSRGIPGQPIVTP